ncbi:Retrovirus-related Pol polyprotein from transposon [Dictyocoela muelleri]|nr:Retrovirus-related Pol polyprotein from transposon [Dictyocoela muelleri]
MKHFKPLIFGTKVNIFTDNKNLLFKGELTKRMHRWLLLLEEYNYTLNHLTGEDNGEADILSRSMLAISNKNEKIEEIKNLINSINEISSETNKSPETYTLLEKLHISLIHPGRNKMLNTLKKYLDTKNLKTLI